MLEMRKSKSKTWDYLIKAPYSGEQDAILELLHIVEGLLGDRRIWRDLVVFCLQGMRV